MQRHILWNPVNAALSNAVHSGIIPSQHGIIEFPFEIPKPEQQGTRLGTGRFKPGQHELSSAFPGSSACSGSAATLPSPHTLDFGIKRGKGSAGK
ncbi:hypothetical protein N7486_000319 [Penicillium sp. IBT 16267x]|nr:hypothetical protein N7486_000319 [Penicillium sp. IBT 16267x]